MFTRQSRDVKIYGLSDVEHVRNMLFNDPIFDELSNATIESAWSSTSVKTYAFIGDAVLDMITVDMLIDFDQVVTPHEFTVLKSGMVNNKSLECMMIKKHLCDILQIYNKSCADTFEAFIGIQYLYLRHRVDNPYKYIKEWLNEKWHYNFILTLFVHMPKYEVCEIIQQML